jgi:hypothetical protein
MACLRLSLRRIQQLPDLCGPACAQMILLAEGGVKNNSDNVQLELWDEVQANTGNATSGFPITESCSGDPLEWATHPVALRKTLNDHLPGSPVHVIGHSDEDVTTVNVLRSVKQGLAPAVLVEDTTHWIVAVGCSRTQPRGGGVPEETHDGDVMTHILIRDPAAGGYLTRITLDEWRTRLYAVECGDFMTEYVVVGAKPSP